MKTYRNPALKVDLGEDERRLEATEGERGRRGGRGRGKGERRNVKKLQRFYTQSLTSRITSNEKHKSEIIEKIRSVNYNRTERSSLIFEFSSPCC